MIKPKRDTGASVPVTGKQCQRIPAVGHVRAVIRLDGLLLFEAIAETTSVKVGEYRLRTGVQPADTAEMRAVIVGADHKVIAVRRTAVAARRYLQLRIAPLSGDGKRQSQIRQLQHPNI